jgi:3-(3-hydroxy-phenyl)propionate hydroxylase
VREHLQLGFKGRTYPQTFTLADLHVDWGRTDDEFHIFASDDGLAAIFPLGHGLHRLMADFFGEPEYDKPSLEECQAILNRRLHAPPTVSDLRWSSYFHVNSRRVARLRAGRVLVAGDAAHIHSPVAGQGMNTGIQESFNVAWKVALVQKGEAEASLLDTYDEERRPIERDVLKTTDVVINIVGARQGFARLFRDYIAPPFVGTEFAQSYARGFVTETDIDYSACSLTFISSIGGGVRAGERAPDASVHVVAGPDGQDGERQVFDLLSDPGFALLCLIDSETRSTGAGAMQAAVARAVRAPTKVWTIKDNGGPEGRRLADLYGRVRPCFYLVRPDGYVMARGGPADVRPAATFLADATSGTTVRP